MTKLSTLFLSTVIAACTGTGTISDASPLPLFPHFPVQCARQAYEHLSLDRESSSSFGARVSDLGAWESKVDRANSAYGDLMAPSTDLLVRAESNQSKPRVSNEQSRRAQRILRTYSEKVLYRTPVLNSIGQLRESTDFIQYKCLTDTCPAGATCTVIPLHQEGEEFATRLEELKRLFYRTMNWAKETKHLKRRVPGLIKKYNQAENTMRAALNDLPENLYVIDAFIPRR